MHWWVIYCDGSISGFLNTISDTNSAKVISIIVDTESTNLCDLLEGKNQFYWWGCVLAAVYTRVSSYRYLYLLKRLVFWLAVSINITISISCFKYRAKQSGIVIDQQPKSLVTINEPSPKVISISDCFTSC